MQSIVVILITTTIVAILGLILTFSISNQPRRESNVEQYSSSQPVDHTIVITESQFSPSLITTSPGEIFTIEVSNQQGRRDFIVEELNINTGLMNAGEKRIITITIPPDAQHRSFEYYSSIEGENRINGVIQVINE